MVFFFVLYPSSNGITLTKDYGIAVVYFIFNIFLKGTIKKTFFKKASLFVSYSQ